MAQTQWGNKDTSNNSPIWGPTLVGTQIAGTGTANTANRDALYQNTTADAYQNNMTIGVYGVSPGEMADAVGGVSTVTVTAPGSGFTVRPTVSFTGAATSAATATATAKLVTVTSSVGGSGYANGSVVTIAGGTSTVAANVNILTTNSTGGVLTVSVNAAGSYTALPTLANNVPTGGSGSGLKLDLSFGVNAVTVTSNGSGYTAAPSVSFDGGGTGATATATLRTEQSRVTSAGWVLRRKNNLSGRVQYETLVAMKSIVASTASTDPDEGGDDTIFPNV